jgi:hypothetical protein
MKLLRKVMLLIVLVLATLVATTFLFMEQKTFGKNPSANAWKESKGFGNRDSCHYTAHRRTDCVGIPFTHKASGGEAQIIGFI